MDPYHPLGSAHIGGRSPLKDYELTWGIKQSYRAYVAGMAAGTFTPADGATQAADNGAFTFTGGTGSYDSTTHVVKLGRGRDHHRGRDQQRHHTERRPADGRGGRGCGGRGTEAAHGVERVMFECSSD